MKFKNKSDLKCHTEAYEALDSAKTYACDMCDYVGKQQRDWQAISKDIRSIRCDYAGCDEYLIIARNFLITRKRRITF